jgi:hypothetical protein
MNLKAKLCILENYTLLLLGPSPFEHWLESYLCFTVESLCFSDFAIRSPLRLPPSLPPLFPSAACRRRSPAMCAVTAGSVPLRTVPRAVLASAPPLPTPALASPRSAMLCASCPSRSPPSLAIAASAVPPPAFRHSTRHAPTVLPPSRP